MADRWEEVRSNLERSLIRIASCQSMCKSCENRRYPGAVAILNDIIPRMTEKLEERPKHIANTVDEAFKLKKCRTCRRTCSQDVKRIRKIHERSNSLFRAKTSVDEMDDRIDKCLGILDSEQEKGRHVPQELLQTLEALNDDIKGIYENTIQGEIDGGMLNKLRNLESPLLRAIGHADTRGYEVIHGLLKDLNESWSQAISEIDDVEDLEGFEQSLAKPDLEFRSKQKISRGWFAISPYTCIVFGILSFMIGRYARSWTWVRNVGLCVANGVISAGVNFLFNKVAGRKRTPR